MTTSISSIVLLDPRKGWLNSDQKDEFRNNALIILLWPLEYISSNGKNRYDMLLQELRSLSLAYFPVPFPGGEPLNYWTLIRTYLPGTLPQIFTNSDEIIKVISHTCFYLDTPLPMENGIMMDPAITRGLFIARFQPPHLGHIEFIEQCLAQVDELYVIISKPERCFEPENPMTAFERLLTLTSHFKNEQKIKAIFPVKYEDNKLLNMFTLETLLPAFHIVFTINRQIETLSENLGYMVKTPEINATISATALRNAIINNREWTHLVPESCSHVMRICGIVNRIKKLSKEEDRK